MARLAWGRWGEKFKAEGAWLHVHHDVSARGMLGSWYSRDTVRRKRGDMWGRREWILVMKRISAVLERLPTQSERGNEKFPWCIGDRLSSFMFVGWSSNSVACLWAGACSEVWLILVSWSRMWWLCFSLHLPLPACWVVQAGCFWGGLSLWIQWTIENELVQW